MNIENGTMSWRKNYHWILGLLLTIPMIAWTQESQKSCAITYIANEGFLIETKNHKILIDALFGNIPGDWCDQPSDSLVTLMIQGSAPFNSIDVVLVTHKHVDHFHEAIVTKFLKNNKKSFLICPSQAEESLTRNADYSMVSHQIHSLRPGKVLDTMLTFNAINIRALKFDHSTYYQTDSISGERYNIHRDIENIGYVVKTDGVTLFHSGDDTPSNTYYYQTYYFGKMKIDISFLHARYLQAEGWDLIAKYIHTQYIIYTHRKVQSDAYAQAMKSLPGDIPQRIFYSKPMERKIFTVHR
jgi:L-ascorbate metabolism protein UlaG (beta-lactamase superfamily)